MTRECLCMTREQVAQLDELERHDRLARDEELVPRLERLRWQAIGVEPDAAHALEPCVLDPRNTPGAIAVEPALDVLGGRRLVGLPARARAVAWEPVQPHVV